MDSATPPTSRPMRMRPVRFRRSQRDVRWYWVLAVWLGLGLFDGTQTVFVMRSEGMHHYWLRLFITNVVAWVPWMLATPFIFRLGRGLPGGQWKRPAFWIAHLAASAGIGLVASAWVAMWEELLNPLALSPGPDPFVQLWLR